MSTRVRECAKSACKLALALAGSLGVLMAARADVITLDFEGIASHPNNNDVLIQDYYNGGTASNGNSGPNFGVSFTAGATLLCLNTLDVRCSNTSKGGLGIPTSRLAAMYFPQSNPIMNVAGGFDTGFSMTFGNPFAATVGVEIWDGFDGSGNLLASALLPGTPNGATACPDYGFPNYCPFVDFSLAFAGTARSVRFSGRSNISVYDDFTFGSVVPGGDVPEPASLALLGLGLAGLGLSRRRKAA